MDHGDIFRECRYLHSISSQISILVAGLQRLEGHQRNPQAPLPGPPVVPPVPTAPKVLPPLPPPLTPTGEEGRGDVKRIGTDHGAAVIAGGHSIIGALP